MAVLTPTRPQIPPLRRLAACRSVQCTRTRRTMLELTFACSERVCPACATAISVHWKSAGAPRGREEALRLPYPAAARSGPARACTAPRRPASRRPPLSPKHAHARRRVASTRPAMPMTRIASRACPKKDNYLGGYLLGRDITTTTTKYCGPLAAHGTLALRP